MARKFYHTQEAKNKISKNNARFWKGKSLPEEVKRKISEKLKGIKLTEEHRKSISLAQKGIPVKEEVKKRISQTLIGHNVSEETRKKISKAHTGRTGEKSNRWISDRTKIKKQEDRNNPNDKEWKRKVYERDSWKCRMNNEECKGRIEAHHILSWNDYPELRYNINNGITLCQAHHPRKRAEEKRLIPFFQGLVSVSR